MRPSAKDNAGTLPFLTLDLLEKRAFEVQVPLRYRHNAGTFAWCLICICICAGKDERGRIGTINPGSPLIIVARKRRCFRAPPLLVTRSIECPIFSRMFGQPWTHHFGELAAGLDPRKPLRPRSHTRNLQTRKRCGSENRGDILDKSIELVNILHPPGIEATN